MKKKALSMILAASMVASVLAGCDVNINIAPQETEQEEVVASAEDSDETEAATEESEVKAEESESEGEVDYSTGKPWMCSPLEGLVTEDTPTNLKDDYYLYVNKDELVKTVIPEGYSCIGGVYNLPPQFDSDLLDMFQNVKEAQTHDAELAINLYSLYMDWDSRNERGITPLKEAVDKIEEISSIDELNDYFTKSDMKEILTSLFGSCAYGDIYDSNKNNLTVYNANVLLGDSAEYSKLTEYGKIIKDAKSDLTTKMLVKMGYDESVAKEKFDNALAFDEMLADSIYTSNEEQMPDISERMHNMYSYDELKELEGNVPIIEYLENIGFNDFDEIQVTNPKWLERLREVYTDENLPLIKDAIIVRGVIGMDEYLDEECYSWDVECKNSINGSKGEKPYEVVAANNVSSDVEWAVARLYTEKYLNEEDKERISTLVDDVIEEYHTIINDADFISPETKEKAIDKLESMSKFVLYPDDWTPYSLEGLEIKNAADGGTLYEAIGDISEFFAKKENEKIHKPVDKSEWIATPTTINCFYNPSANSVTILGAFARGDLYTSEMSDEEVYGKLGIVIGHEISHAFDSAGAQYDKFGNMSNWWTDEDLAAFNEKNQKLADYYNSLTLWEGEKVNGDIVTGESCADMGGVRCMINLGKKKPGFDFDKFYQAYAKVWFLKASLQRIYSTNTDVHPQTYHRVNAVLQQFPEFLEFYGIKEGDGMYLAPEDRVNIW